MSFFNPSARISVNKQLGFEYAIVLSFGNHFKGVTCNSAAKEATMKINYAEMSKELKAHMTEICEGYAEKCFAQAPDLVVKSEVKVSFLTRSDGIHEIDFWGNAFVLRVIGRYSNRKDRCLIKTEYRERREA